MKTKKKKKKKGHYNNMKYVLFTVEHEEVNEQFRVSNDIEFHG